MRRPSTQSVPQPDRAYQVYHSRRLRAMWKIFWMVLGIGCALVLLFLDIKYTADGLLPVFGHTETSLYLCWALSIIMSPLELAGTQIQVERYLKVELTKDLRIIIQVMVVLVFAADIITNLMGLIDAATSAGVVMGTGYYALIGIVGIGLAFIEYLIDAFVVILSKELASFKDAQRHLEAMEGQESGGHRPMPSRSGSMPRPAPTRVSSRDPMARPSRSEGPPHPREYLS